MPRTVDSFRCACTSTVIGAAPSGMITSASSIGGGRTIKRCPLPPHAAVTGLPTSSFVPSFLSARVRYVRWALTRLKDQVWSFGSPQLRLNSDHHVARYDDAGELSLANFGK